jgi:hypothetical protein
MNIYTFTLQNNFFHTFILEVTANSCQKALSDAYRFVQSTSHHVKPSVIPSNINIIE